MVRNTDAHLYREVFMGGPGAMPLKSVELKEEINLPGQTLRSKKGGPGGSSPQTPAIP